jgi:hypothetical protein
MRKTIVVISLFAGLLLNDIPGTNALFTTLTEGKQTWLLEEAGLSGVQSTPDDENLLLAARSGDYYSCKEFPGIGRLIKSMDGESCSEYQVQVFQERNGSGMIHRAVVLVATP